MHQNPYGNTLGRVDELPDHDPGRHNVNKGQKSLTELVITRGNASELLELIEKPLHFLA
jgi:hypothetical protein